jgi:hypothetical protein
LDFFLSARIVGWLRQWQQRWSNGASRGAGHPGTPSANYAITVNGAVSTVTRSVQVFVTVK